MSQLTYAGRTFELTIDNGVVFHNTYASSGTKLRTETVAGPTTGAVQDVELHATEITPGVFLVGWVEASGTTVTHAMNLNTSTVHAFWTFDTPAGRVAELHTGHLKEL